MLLSRASDIPKPKHNTFPAHATEVRVWLDFVQVMERRMQHRLGRQRQRVIKRLRRAREVREAEERRIAMKLEQANQVSTRWQVTQTN